MIPQQAMDEVRHGVLQRLRRRKTAKRAVAATALALACIAWHYPRPTEKPPQPLVSSIVQKDQEWGRPLGLRLAPRPAPPRTPIVPVKPEKASQGASRRPVGLPHLDPQKPEPAVVPEIAQRPAYIKIFTDNPDVVFLLLTSDEGGI